MGVTIYQVTDVLHPIGITLASLVLLITLIITVYDRSLINRVTLRLIIIVAIADIFTHTKDYLIKNYRTNDGLCVFYSAFTYFSTYLYCFTNIAVSYNFQRTFIQNKASTWKFEMLTWLVVLIVSLGITIIFWLLGTFGFDPIQKKCVGITTNWVFLLRGHFQWILCSFTVLYCLGVILKIHFGLKTYVDNYLNAKTFSPSYESKHKEQMKKLIQRGLLYPLSPIITLTPMIAYMIRYLLKNDSTDTIQWLLGIGFGLSGVLTFIAFCIDLTLQKALKTIYYKLINKYHDNNSDNNLYFYNDIEPCNNLILIGSKLTSGKTDFGALLIRQDEEFLDLTKAL
jgi:hypothetical protein